MPEIKSKAELIKIILEDADDEKLEEDEMMAMLLHHKVSKNLNRIQSENLSFGARMADGIAKFAGSWTFILIFIGCLVLWIVANTLILAKAFDVYPFILLNLLLSCIAAIQAPVIMMSQNRQEEKDRLRSQNDYETNLKSEIIIEDLYQKLSALLETQENILHKLCETETSSDKPE